MTELARALSALISARRVPFLGRVPCDRSLIEWGRDSGADTTPRDVSATIEFCATDSPKHRSCRFRTFVRSINLCVLGARTSPLFFNVSVLAIVPASPRKDRGDSKGHTGFRFARIFNDLAIAPGVAMLLKIMVNG